MVTNTTITVSQYKYRPGFTLDALSNDSQACGCFEPLRQKIDIVLNDIDTLKQRIFNYTTFDVYDKSTMFTTHRVVKNRKTHSILGATLTLCGGQAIYIDKDDYERIKSILDVDDSDFKKD